MSSTAAATPLDFAALLSRNHRPARATLLIPQEAYKEADGNEKHDKNKRSNKTDKEPSDAEKAFAHDLEVSKLVMDLVSQTPEYSRHVGKELSSDVMHKVGSNSLKALPSRKHDWETLPPSLHEVELGDWEKNIRWDGVAADQIESEPGNKDAANLLGQRRNVHLDNLVFDESTINWEGSREKAAEMARKTPLILELGVAGQSVACHALPVSRPVPFAKSAPFLERYEREWATPATSTAELSKGTLHADKEKMEAIIKARQQKRAQMAKDKTERVTAAMGTLAGLGGGKGRTITSSLMGPGGTERTGRPTRFGVSSSTHDMEYIEQLDLVNNYTLVKPDLSKLELRQFHRPRLPLSAVRKDRPWQFQIRYIPTGKKPDPTNNASSYQSMVSGTHAGAQSQAKLRTETDLSPTEGDLVLLEYSEERPPLQPAKGMASKIVNFYRGDRSKCPVSAGGGDRPTRRKRRDNTSTGAKETSSSTVERPPRLLGPNEAASTSVMDWIGKPPKKSGEDRGEKHSIDILPEGVTEILHSKVHGPFIGEVEDGVTQTGLITNLFVAPMFRHEPESTDFLMILGKKTGSIARPGGVVQPIGVVLRPLPASLFSVGQIEPKVKVWAPNTTGERNFINPFISYQIAKALKAKEGQGLRFDEISDSLFANTVIQPGAMRQRARQVAIYDKNKQIWTSKPDGFEDYPGLEALGRKFTPEGVVAYETASAAARRLCDLGIHELYSGTSSVASVGIAMIYVTGQMNAAREISRKMKKTLDYMKTSKNIKSAQVALYQRAAETLETAWKDVRRKHEVARFIFEELQLAPWHLTAEFIDVHKNGQGTGMMRLTGLADPSGRGEGFNFLREVDTKPNKGSGQNNGALNAQIKKITGTENDLRKLTMKQMASLLRSYNMKDKEIATLKRWDRVHVIRDLSTKAANDGMGDGLERFARGEKMKLSDQKRMYQARIQEIWRRQRAALSSDAGDPRAATSSGGAISSAVPEADSALEADDTPTKQADKDKEESESDSDDDDLAAMLEEDMMDVRQTNQLVAAHMRGSAGEDEGSRVGLAPQLREGADDVNKEARELAALKRQREEERATQEGLKAGSSKGMGSSLAAIGHEQTMIGKKVIRRRITKTFPDGRQTTTFKFIVVPEEVEKIRRRIHEEESKEHPRKKKHEYKPDSRPVGHAMFEDEDDFDHHRSRTGIRLQVQRTTRTVRGGTMKAPMLAKGLQLGKLKQRVSHEQRRKKRQREAEEADLYVTVSKRRGSVNRRERSAARKRLPHVILADKLENIRLEAEKRPGSGPFHRPVPRRDLPRYYEVISDPIDLQTIRDKNQRYEYKTAEAFLREFDLMRRNAVKFNGAESLLAGEANNIYEFVKDQILKSRTELDAMEEAVREQLGGKKRKKKAKTETSSSGAGGNVGVVDGVAVNLGDLSGRFAFDADSDSDDSVSGLMHQM